MCLDHRFRGSHRPLVEALKLEIDPGEAEAIACAIELNAERLLLDERLGRNVSQRLGVQCIGLFGLLIEAKNKGRVNDGETACG